MKKLLFLVLILPFIGKGQSEFPKITGHAGIVHAIVTVSDGTASYNFNNSYSVSFPVAINIWKTNKIGFSFEAFPTIKNENGSHKMTNFTFHPGILYRFTPTFTFAGRAAFETSGRYGVTPVFTKVFKKNKYSNYYIAIPLPVRTGADKPISAGLAVQLGVSF